MRLNQSATFLKQLDTRIQREKSTLEVAKNRVTALENARAIMVATEPETLTTPTKRGRGRPRKHAAKTSTGPKRGPGRPKGSKNKPAAKPAETPEAKSE
jgi:hypothetical protein